MKEVLNCPFCGRQPSKQPRFCMGYIGNGLKCKCGCETPSHLVGAETLKWWNNRAEGESK